MNLYRGIVYGDKQPHYIVAPDLDAAKDILRENLTERAADDRAAMNAYHRSMNPNAVAKERPLFRYSIASIEHIESYPVLIVKAEGAA